MVEVPFEFHAMVRRVDGSSCPFRCYVSGPRYDEGSSFYCYVDCLEIDNRARAIHGVDAEQAIELSFKFLKTMLDHHRLCV